MKKISLILLFFCSTVIIYAETIDFSARTGYISGMEEEWNINYSDLNDLLPDTDSREAGPGTYELIDHILDDMQNIEDEMIDYGAIAKDIAEMIENGVFEIKTNTDEDITHVALVSTDENENLTLYLSRYYLEKEDLLTLVISSVVREFKVIYDYMNNKRFEYISANKLEEYLYILDSYYFQSRYINHAFIEKGYKVTRFEWFLSVDYKDNYLASFSNYFLGIDRDVVISGKMNLDKLINGEIEILEYLTIQYENFEKYLGLYNNTDTNEFYKEVNEITTISFLPFFLEHYTVMSQINDNEEYQKLLRQLYNLVDNEILYNNSVEEIVYSYRFAPEMRE